MELKDVELHIESDGHRVSEYQIKTELDKKTITCFIPSTAGKKFEIYCVSKRPELLAVYCTIDGRQINGTLCSPFASSSIKGLFSAEDKIAPLLFSSLVLVDDETFSSDSETLGKLGTIELQVIRVHRTGTSPTALLATPKCIGPVHEKSKKVGGHCISFGEASTCAPVSWAITTPMYPAEGNWAKFIFKYRPEEILRAQGIIEKPKTPPHKSGPVMAPLKRSRSAALAEENQTPKLSSTSQEHPAKKVKTERQDEDVIDLTQVGEDPPKLLDPSLRGTVIDLTLDD
ncbi:hypothetical protein QCA50_004933 [Cerrena zonata]|uniref:DUF7918 domain-containing protein n=1 Tax=Cerrena zonata TaxID=2478898 RepID=A0AAW0GK66_9APHY